MSDTPDILAGLDMAAPPPTAEEHAAFRARMAARRAEEGKPAACTRCLRQIATWAECQATEGHALRCECDECGPRCFASFGLSVVCEELHRDRLAKLRTVEDAARDAILADAACLPPGVLARIAAAYRKPRRPVVLVDVDGVLANFIEANLRTLHAIGAGPFVHDDVTTWDMEDCLGLTAPQRARMKARWAEPGFAASIPEYPGAREGVAALREVADVYACTAPMHSSPTWQHERHHWLVERFGFDHKQIVQTPAKYLVRGDMLIDDKPEHVAAWQEANPGGVGVLWSRAYNAGADLRRESEWEAAARCVLLMGLEAGR